MPRLKLRTDAPGYVLDGELVDGFPDQPGLPVLKRRLIAGWARDLGGRPSPEQERLLEDVEPSGHRSSPRQRELAQAREELAHLSAAGLLDGLSDDERGWLRRPATHPAVDDDKRYPLTVGDLHRMTGATERQIRHWIDIGLVLAVRTPAGRKVYASGLAQALLLARLDQPEKTVLARIGAGREADFLLLLGLALEAAVPPEDASLRAQVAETSRLLGDVARAMRVTEHRRDEPESAPDLMSALRASLAATGRRDRTVSGRD